MGCGGSRAEKTDGVRAGHGSEEIGKDGGEVAPVIVEIALDGRHVSVASQEDPVFDAAHRLPERLTVGPAIPHRKDAVEG